MPYVPSPTRFSFWNTSTERHCPSGPPLPLPPTADDDDPLLFDRCLDMDLSAFFLFFFFFSVCKLSFLALLIRVFFSVPPLVTSRPQHRRKLVGVYSQKTVHVCRQSALSPSYIYFCTLFWLSCIHTFLALYIPGNFCMCCAP